MVLLGMDAASDNPIPSGEYCFNISVEVDSIKEAKEVFMLGLTSNDECVCLGRDLALALTEANGGRYVTKTLCWH